MRICTVSCEYPRIPSANGLSDTVETYDTSMHKYDGTVNYENSFPNVGRRG